MYTPRISAIAAIGKNRELGRTNDLIWRISEDIKRVKQLTMGHPLIMGRKTYESIGKPLPGRTTIIVTRDPNFRAEGCVVVHSLEDALKQAREIETEEIFIFGGAQLYEQALPIIDRLYLTIVDAEDPTADTYFPDYDDFAKVIEKEKRDHDGLEYEWLTLERA